jgi:hypothetical protein
MTAGDVYTYTPDQHHCREGLAIENERGMLIDWFWGGHDMALDNIVDRAAADLTLIANLNDYDLTPQGGRCSNREYARGDRLVITSQHGLQRTYYVRKGALPDLSTKIENARAALSEAESELRSARFQVERSAEALAKLEAEAAA